MATDRNRHASAVIVRAAAVDDMIAVQTIYAHHVVHGLGSFELDAPSVDEMTERFAAVRAARLPFLVAEAAGATIGYAYAAPYRPRPAYRYTAEVSVYVAPTAQRNGIGRRLLDAVVQRSADEGIRQLVAVIGDSGNAASIALHRSAGFGGVGVLRGVGWKHDRWVDTVFMQRDVGDGSATPPADTR